MNFLVFAWSQCAHWPDITQVHSAPGDNFLGAFSYLASVSLLQQQVFILYVICLSPKAYTVHTYLVDVYESFTFVFVLFLFWRGACKAVVWSFDSSDFLGGPLTFDFY